MNYITEIVKKNKGNIRNEFDSFMQGTARNAWIQYPKRSDNPHIKAYIRKGKIFHKGKIYKSIDLATVDSKKKGSFKSLIQHMEKHLNNSDFDVLHVENVLNPELEEGLKKHGYIPKEPQYEGAVSLLKFKSTLNEAKQVPSGTIKAAIELFNSGVERNNNDPLVRGKFEEVIKKMKEIHEIQKASLARGTITRKNNLEKIKKEKIKNVLADWITGKPRKQIIFDHKTSWATLREILNDHATEEHHKQREINQPINYPTYHQTRAIKIIDDYRAGHKKIHIMRTHDVYDRTFNKIIDQLPQEIHAEREKNIRLNSEKKLSSVHDSILKSREKGESIPNLVSKFGRTRVRELVRAGKIKSKNKPHPPEVIQSVLKMDKEGHSDSTIAAEHGFKTRMVVRGILHRFRNKLKFKR